MGVYHHKKPIVNDGLVFSVDANNKLGGNVTDTKNLSNPLEVGTFTNGLTVVNGSFDFDGVDDYADLGNIHDTTFQGSFTITAWIKPILVGTSFMSVCGKNKIKINSPQRAYLQVRGDGFAPNNRFELIIEDFLGGEDLFNDTDLVHDVWQQIAVSYNLGTTTKSYYLNGQPDGTNNETNTYSPNDAPFVVGDWGHPSEGGTQQPFKGGIANLQIYNRVLTPTEVLNNYNSQKGRFE